MREFVYRCTTLSILPNFILMDKKSQFPRGIFIWWNGFLIRYIPYFKMKAVEHLRKLSETTRETRIFRKQHAIN